MQAETGSGKTAAYLLPLLNALLTAPATGSGAQPRSLVLVPTRELCQQARAQPGAEWAGRRSFTTSLTH